MGQQSERVFVVSVGFYEKYHQQASALAGLLARKLNAQACYLVWNNSELPRASLEAFTHVLQSDNSQWEFSAWDLARQQIEREFGLRESDIIIFLNDTVRFHRIFTRLDVFLLLYKLKILRGLHGSTAALLGEKLSPGKQFSLRGQAFTQWISTYCFAVNGKFLQQAQRLHFSAMEFEELIAGVDEAGIQFLPAVNPVLAQHINGWLFPKADQHGWYKAKAGGAKIPAEIMQKKAMAILNEKRLSCICQNADGVLIGLYDELPERKYKTWKDKKYKKAAAHS